MTKEIQMSTKTEAAVRNGLVLDVNLKSIYINKYIKAKSNPRQFNGGFMSFGVSEASTSSSNSFEFPTPSSETSGLKKKRRNGRSETYSCSICPRVFKCKGYLNMHMVTHTESGRNIPCDVCGKSFAQRGHLVLHQKAHQSRKRKNILDEPMCLDFIAPEPTTSSGHYHQLSTSDNFAVNQFSSSVPSDPQPSTSRTDSLDWPDAGPDTLTSLDNLNIVDCTITAEYPMDLFDFDESLLGLTTLDNVPTVVVNEILDMEEEQKAKALGNSTTVETLASFIQNFNVLDY